MSVVNGSASAPWTPNWARELARKLLGDVPCRLAHLLRAGDQASHVGQTVPAADTQLLITAALLHDIGYAPELRRTAFHPLDGATTLRDELGAPERLAGLVGHHSEAWLLASARGLLSDLPRFPIDGGPVTDALTYADMTSGPCGALMTVTERLADISARHANEPPALQVRTIGARAALAFRCVPGKPASSSPLPRRRSRVDARPVALRTAPARHRTHRTGFGPISLLARLAASVWTARSSA